MSRSYGMYVTIKAANPSRFEEIKAAASAEWPFDDWHEYEGGLTALADSTLCGGETEEAFTERFSKAVWKANDGFCIVALAITPLEELPFDSYQLDENDYRRIIEDECSDKTFYRNRYRCTCGKEWEDVWSCMCNDRCPRCNTEIEPFESLELLPEK